MVKRNLCHTTKLYSSTVSMDRSKHKLLGLSFQVAPNEVLCTLYCVDILGSKLINTYDMHTQTFMSTNT